MHEMRKRTEKRNEKNNQKSESDFEFFARQMASECERLLAKW